MDSDSNKEGQKLEGQGMVLQKSFFNGTTGGTMSMQEGKKAYTAEEIASKQKSSGFIPEMNYNETGMTYELIGIEIMDDKEVYVMKINDGEKDTYDYYDKATSLKVKTMTTQTQGEETVTSEISYSDFSDHDGFMFADKMTIQAVPITLSGTIKTLEINEKIDLTFYE